MDSDPFRARQKIKSRIANLFDTFELLLRGFFIFLLILNLYHFFKGEHLLRDIITALGCIGYLTLFNPPKRREPQ